MNTELPGMTTRELATPPCVRDTLRLLEKERERLRGMIDDLHQLADQNHGMDPEDCDLLMRLVCDREKIDVALPALRGLFE